MGLETLRETVEAMKRDVEATDDLEKCLELWAISIHAHSSADTAAAEGKVREQVQHELARLMEVEHGFLLWKACHDKHDPPAMVRKEFAPTVTRLLTQPAEVERWAKDRGLA